MFSTRNVILVKKTVAKKVASKKESNTKSPPTNAMGQTPRLLLLVVEWKSETTKIKIIESSKTVARKMNRLKMWTTGRTTNMNGFRVTHHLLAFTPNETEHEHSPSQKVRCTRLCELNVVYNLNTIVVLTTSLYCLQLFR